MHSAVPAAPAARIRAPKPSAMVDISPLVVASLVALPFIMVPVVIWPRSKARQMGERQQAAADTHPAEFGATVQRRNSLVGIEQARRIEGPLDREEGLQLGRRELQAHRIDLLDAGTMLAGDGAADLHAQRQ